MGAFTFPCGKRLQVPFEHLGKKCKCPQCGVVWKIRTLPRQLAQMLADQLSTAPQEVPACLHASAGQKTDVIPITHGEGHVVYTPFHNAANLNDEMAQVVAYVNLQTISLAVCTPFVELTSSTQFDGL